MVRDGGMVVGFDRASRNSIKALVKAVDRLSDAVLGGVDVEVLTDDPVHVATLRRLVEDVKLSEANRQVDGGEMSRVVFRPRDSRRLNFEESV